MFNKLKVDEQAGRRRRFIGKKKPPPWAGWRRGFDVGGLLILAAVLGAGLLLGLAARGAVRTLFSGEGGGGEGGDGGCGDEGKDGFHDVGCVVFLKCPL